MIVTAWLLLLFFGFFALHGLLNLIEWGLTDIQLGVFLLSGFITAVSAGIIWGGLFQ